MIVDDEKSYADLLAQLIRDNVDCTVHVFYRAAAALAAIPDLKPRVIVTDYHMPEINGFDFIRRATVMLPEVPVILISGHNLSASAEEMTGLSAIKSHLAKPFGWRQLAAEIVKVWPDTQPPSLRGTASFKG